MNTRAWFTFLVRVAALGVVIALLYAFGFVALKWNASFESFAWLLLTGLLQAAVIGYVLVRSTWHGWKLIATLFFVYVGITVFQSNIEAFVFLEYFVSILPEAALPEIIVNAVIASAVIAPLAVVIFDKFKPSRTLENESPPLHLNPWQWIWKVGALAVIYVIIYSVFGMVVAKPLAGAAFDEYYRNLQLPVWFFPFQIVRGAIWVLLTIPIIRMMRGSPREIGLGVALLLAVTFASLVIPPVEFMPASIRFAHLVELFTSMFVFGWIDYWLLTWQRQPTTRQTNLRGAPRAT